MTDTKHVPEILITRDEAAERAGVGTRTIDYWRRTNKITTYKDGRGRVRVDPEEIDDLLTIKPVSA